MARDRATEPRLGLLALGALGAAVGTAVALWWFVRADRVPTPAWSVATLAAVLAVLALHAAAHAANGARMAALSGGAVPWLRGWATVTVGVFGAAATPARIGGEALKAVDLRRVLPWPALLSLLLAERLFDLLVLALGGALVVAALVGVLEVRAPVALVVATAALAAVAALLWGLSRLARRRNPRAGSGRVGRSLATLREALAGLAALPRGVVVAATLLTVLVWALEIAGFAAVAAALSVPVRPLHAVVLVLGVTLLQALPLLPSGAGTVDAYAVLLLPTLGAEVGAAYLVWRSSVLAYDLVVGGVAASVRLVGGHGVAQEARHGVQDQSGDQ